MKKLLLTTFALLTAIMAMAQEEVVLECSYESNQAYKTLLVITEDGGEAMSIAGEKKCHYDLEVQTMGNHIIILAKNASLSGWVDDIYIISGDDKCFVVSPLLSSNNYAKINAEEIEGSSQIAAKKREYGLTNYKGGASSGSSSSNRNL